MSRKEQGGDGSGSERCHKPDTGIAFTAVSESLDTDYPRIRDGRVSSSSGHSPMAVVETTDRSTYRKDVQAEWNEHARAGIATYIILHRRGTGGSGEGKVVLGSAQTSVDTVRRTCNEALESAEPQGYRQGGGMTCLHGCYHRRVCVVTK